MEKQKSLFREFGKYVSFNVAGMVGYSCYILADTFFIAKALGADGLTALNLALPLFTFMSGLGLMLGMGGGTRFSIFHSQGQGNRGNQVFTEAVSVGILIAVLFMGAGLFLAGPISALLGAEDLVYDLTKSYLRIILLFAPLFITNNVLQCFVRNDGSPGLAMLAMVTGSLANVLLDYVFMFPLGMGMMGAALATCMAPAISIIILSVRLLRKKGRLHFVKTSFSRHSVKSTSSLGISALITEVSSGIVIIAFNGLFLNLMGNIAVAAYSIVANLALVIISIFTGIAQGMQPLASREYGAGNWKNSRLAYRWALSLAFLCAILIYGGLSFFADPVAAIFNEEGNETLQRLAVSGLRLYFTAFFFIGFNIVTAAFFSAVEIPRPAFAMAISRGFLVILPCAFFMAMAFGVTGVWLSFPLAEALTALLGLIFFRRIFGSGSLGRQKEKKMLK